MLKKSIIIISLFAITIFMSGSVFASNITNATGNTLDGIRDGVQNMMADSEGTMDRARNGVGNAMENVGDGLENMAHDVGGAMESAKDGISNMLHDGEAEMRNADNNIENTADNAGTGFTGTADGSYTAARTSATDATGIGGANNSTIWVVLAVAGAIIIALVWYYATQTNNTDRY